MLVISIFTFQIREMEFTVIVCCVFSVAGYFYTTLNVHLFFFSLNYWSYVFFFSFYCAASKWICQTSHTFRDSSERSEKKSETMGKRWPSELVWYYILFQSYTITNWNHITPRNRGPDNLLKGQFPERGDLWPQACQQSSAGWLGHWL